MARYVYKCTPGCRVPNRTKPRRTLKANENFRCRGRTFPATGKPGSLITKLSILGGFVLLGRLLHRFPAVADRRVAGICEVLTTAGHGVADT